jgi:integrase
VKKPKNSDPAPTRPRLRITETYLESVRPPASGRLALRDGNPPGFGVSVTPNGVKSFILDYLIFNRNRRITLGRWPEMTVEQARDAATQARRDVRENRDPLLTKHESRAVRTVHELAADYLTKYAEPYKRASSVDDDRTMLASIVRPRIGDYAVAAVTKEHVQKIHRDLAATPYRANRCLALLSKMFNLAVEWNATNKVWRSDNPALGVKKYPEEKRSRWLDKKEIGSLLKVLDKYPEQKTANAIRLILLTGSRKGEALAAKWPDIDLKNRLWRKDSAHTKQKREEFVPLNSDAVKLLKRMRKTAKDGDEFLFPGRIADRPLEDLKIHWAEIRKQAGLPNVRIHDLRHTYASHLVSTGVPLFTVGKLLGHTQGATTERYAHVAQAPQRAASEKFSVIYRDAKTTTRKRAAK